MSAESIKENAIRKVIQELIVPDLKKLIGKIDILEERINSTNTRIDALSDKLNTKIDSLKNETDIKFNALKNEIDDNSEKINIKIDALSEKVDYMNKTNERLFDIIFHSTGKENNRPK